MSIIKYSAGKNKLLGYSGEAGKGSDRCQGVFLWLSIGFGIPVFVRSSAVKAFEYGTEIRWIRKAAGSDDWAWVSGTVPAGTKLDMDSSEKSVVPGEPYSQTHDNKIMHNTFVDTVQKLADSGAIYTLGDMPGTEISENFIIGIGKPDAQPPYYITVDIGKVLPVSSVSYIPREATKGNDGSMHGIVTAYEIETSENGSDWTTAAEGTWSYDTLALDTEERFASFDTVWTYIGVILLSLIMRSPNILSLSEHLKIF